MCGYQNKIRILYLSGEEKGGKTIIGSNFELDLHHKFNDKGSEAESIERKDAEEDDRELLHSAISEFHTHRKILKNSFSLFTIYFHVTFFSP